MKALLLRHTDSPAGVFGFLDLLTDSGVRLARYCTAEDDWLNNAPRVSCIPAGIYTCQRVVSPKHGNVFEITHVPGRSAILIHSGNTENDVEGCVLVGHQYGALQVADEDVPGHPVVAKWAVIQSKVALADLMARTAGLSSFQLEVRWAKPGEWRT